MGILYETKHLPDGGTVPIPELLVSHNSFDSLPQEREMGNLAPGIESCFCFQCDSHLLDSSILSTGLSTVDHCRCIYSNNLIYAPGAKDFIRSKIARLCSRCGASCGDRGMRGFNSPI